MNDSAQWLVPALFTWLAHPRVRSLAVREGCATPSGIAILGGLLHEALTKGQPVEPGILKREALSLLRNRKIRRAIARVVLDQQHRNANSDPEAPSPDKPRKVLADLQEIREQLAEELDRRIILPFGESALTVGLPVIPSAGSGGTAE